MICVGSEVSSEISLLQGTLNSTVWQNVRQDCWKQLEWQPNCKLRSCIPKFNFRGRIGCGPGDPAGEQS